MDISTQTFLLLAVLFDGLGAYAWRRQEPMWFWTGTHVNPDTVSDIRAYNRANAIMWWVYALPYWVAALLNRRWPETAAQVVALAATAGLVLLVLTYLFIRRRYRKA